MMLSAAAKYKMARKTHDEKSQKEIRDGNMLFLFYISSFNILLVIFKSITMIRTYKYFHD